MWKLFYSTPSICPSFFRRHQSRLVSTTESITPFFHQSLLRLRAAGATTGFFASLFVLLACLCATSSTSSASSARRLGSCWIAGVWETCRIVGCLWGGDVSRSGVSIGLIGGFREASKRRPQGQVASPSYNLMSQVAPPTPQSRGRLLYAPDCGRRSRGRGRAGSGIARMSLLVCLVEGACLAVHVRRTELVLAREVVLQVGRRLRPDDSKAGW